MLSFPDTFLTILEAQQETEQILIYTFIQSQLGFRIYGMQSPDPTHMGIENKMIFYDGITMIGDNAVFGSNSLVLDWGARLLNGAVLRETLASEGDNLLGNLTAKEIETISPIYDNSDGHFCDIFATESFLGQKIQYKMGFPSLTVSDFITIFTGRIMKEELTETTLALYAERIE